MGVGVDLPKLRKRLEAIRSKLEAELAAMEVPGHEKEGTASPADTNAEAVMLQLPLRRCREDLLHQVQAALARINSGTYGLCEHCGREIQPERLEALPYATLCINCAQERALQRRLW